MSYEVLLMQVNILYVECQICKLLEVKLRFWYFPDYFGLMFNKPKTCPENHEVSTWSS